MLSKEQKLKYGEVLRQQMKEKEEIKRIEKRGGRRREEPQMENRPPTIKKQNHNDSFKRSNDSKQQLQRQFESQDYAYLGGIGGQRRAPEQRGGQNVSNSPITQNYSQPNRLRMPVDEMMQHEPQYRQQQQVNRLRTQQDILDQKFANYSGGQNHQYMQQQQQSISPNSYQQYPTDNINHYQNPNQNQSGDYGRARQNEVNQQQYRLPQGYYNYSDNQPQTQIANKYPPRNLVSQQYIPEGNSRQNQPQQSSIRQNQYTAHQESYNPQTHQATYEQNQDDELMDVYRKGGRNLLKLENETVDEHLVKQKRKMEIQRQLKQQIEQADRKKKEEKERNKREEQEQQRKHKAYLQDQKRKLQEEERKKRQEKQKIIDDNARNLEMRKKMEDEAKKKTQQEQREKQQRQRAKEQKDQFDKDQAANSIKQNNASLSSQPANQISRKFKVQDDNFSVVSSETSSIEKGFDTGVSKEFFIKERQKEMSKNNDHKLERFTKEIQKMRDEMHNQSQMFHDEIQSVKEHAERALIDKKKAEQEIDRLKRELKRKMDEDNQKLYRALQQNDYQGQEKFHQLPTQKRKKQQRDYEDPVQEDEHPDFKKSPLRQKDQQKLVKQKFESMNYHQLGETNDFMAGSMGNGLMSLDGQSKKIPVNLQNREKLTISQVGDFAKDSAYFQRGFNISPQKAQNFSKINESIAQVEERDFESRKSKRDQPKPMKDQLDNLMESRQQSRGGWGQMSSVNSDITKQIEDLLKKKQKPSNARPNSISNAGKQSLSREAFSYDGMTLNSGAGGTIGTQTIDLNRINGHNEARLRQLRNLGVETINTTNGDDELNQLDSLLSKYK